MRIFLVVALATSCCFFLPGGNGEKKADIGKCENIEVPEMPDTPPQWVGAMNHVIGIIGGPASTILGEVFFLLETFSIGGQDPFDWDQYAEDLSQCVEAMIATAILEDSLAECKTKQETIAVNEGYLLEQFDKIDDAPDLNIIIAEIASIIDVITDKMDELWEIFRQGNRPHELYTDFVLDAVTQGAAMSRFAVIAAYKCKGVPQNTITGYANQYADDLQNFYDDVLIESPYGLKYVLENSEFNTWGTNPEEYVYQDNMECEQDTGENGPCSGDYKCIIKDRYRDDHQVGEVDSAGTQYGGCCGRYEADVDEDNQDKCYYIGGFCEDGSEFEDIPDGSQCCLIDEKFRRCYDIEKEGWNYANNCYVYMLDDITFLAGDFVLKMKDDIMAVAEGELEDFDGLCDYFGTRAK